MLSNLHQHTTFCDGKSTAEEVVLSALEKGFSSIGFSGHGYTEFDLRYCMKDPESYIKEIIRLKEKYKKDIEIYLGCEEDMFAPCDRSRFEYLISSSHYFEKDGKYYPIDSGFDYFSECLKLFDGDILALADRYYSNFVTYLKKRKPDIIGHFDLITKFEEVGAPTLLKNDTYNKMAADYLLEACKIGSIFEVNTGAISRGYRTLPYPDEKLLHLLKKEDAKITVSADSHHKDTVDCYFSETRKLLKDVGFEYIWQLYGGEFVKDYL